MPELVSPSAISSSTSRSRSESSASGRVASVSEQPPHDLRVQRRAAAGDAFGGLEEVVDGEHAVFEEVAEASEGDQLDGVGGLDVLGEHEHPDVRVGCLISCAARVPSSVKLGGILMSSTTRSGGGRPCSSARPRLPGTP